jgi:hypothetical protein
VGREWHPICKEAGSQLNPRIVTDGAGGGMVTWYDYRPTGFGVYAQRIISREQRFGLIVEIRSLPNLQIRPFRPLCPTDLAAYTLRGRMPAKTRSTSSMLNA